MARFRPLIYVLLCLTSLHVLVADVGVHEHMISHQDDGAAFTLADHSHPDLGDGVSLLQHCCQCHGFVSPLAALDSAERPFSPQYTAPVPVMPPAPAFGFYRPPRSLV